jgi:spore germination cell wall hydrolase CwlJ-like protein
MLLKSKLRNYLEQPRARKLTVMFLVLWLSLSLKENSMANLYDMTTQKSPQESEAVALARMLFSETKDMDDARKIANVTVNRTKRPERFGGTITDVIYQPNQFSGVYSDEWNKALNQKFASEKEENIYKEMLQVAYQAVTGKLEDTTGGADHYFNPKLVKPKWAAKMKKTTENKNHSYYKE